MWRNLAINGFEIQHACGFVVRMEQEHSCSFVYSSREGHGKRERVTPQPFLMLHYSLLLIGALFLFIFRYFARSDVGVQAKRVLFVTAHPDDEVMFFAPTLITLARGTFKLSRRSSVLTRNEIAKKPIPIKTFIFCWICEICPPKHIPCSWQIVSGESLRASRSRRVVCKVWCVLPSSSAWGKATLPRWR